MELGCEVGPEDLFAYCYALLASPAYAGRFSEELTIPGPRVPLTKDPALFRQGAALGTVLIRLHTYGERFAKAGHPAALQGSARCTRPVGETVADYPNDFEYYESRRTLRVGAGEFGPVRPEVWEFSVSGFQVVKSWLGYRMRRGHGASVVAAGRDSADALDGAVHAGVAGTAVGAGRVGGAATGVG